MLDISKFVANSIQRHKDTKSNSQVLWSIFNAETRRRRDAEGTQGKNGHLKTFTH